MDVINFSINNMDYNYTWAMVIIEQYFIRDCFITMETVIKAFINQINIIVNNFTFNFINS